MLVYLAMSGMVVQAQSTGGNATATTNAYSPGAPAGSHAATTLLVPGPNPDGWLFPVTQFDERLPSWLQFGAQFRDRVEGQEGLKYAPTYDMYDLTQLRLSVDIQPTKWFKVSATTQDSRVFFNQHVPYASPYQNTWDIREAYAQFGSSESGWIDASVGREILSFGDERVIGPSDWSNMGRTFDTARVDLHWTGIKASLFAASVISARDGVVDHHIEGNNLYGLYSSFTKVIPHATLEPYLLWRVAPAGLRLSENAGLGHLSEVTGGARVAGTLRSVDYDVEMNKQTGSLGPKTIDAWAGHWNAGYTFTGARVKPRPFVEYNYASGNKNPNGQTWSTHDQIYPSAHDKMDFADQFGWRNVKDLRAGVEQKLWRDWTLMEVVDNVWLATKNDALYNNSGAVSVAAHPNVTSTHVGTELELVMEAKHGKHISYGFGAAHLFTGKYLDETTSGRDLTYPFAYSTYVF